MDMYCSIDDAFNGPTIPPPGATKKKKKTKDGAQAIFVPGEPDRFAEKPTPQNDILESPQSLSQQSQQLQHTNQLRPSTEDQFFPLPGDTATPEAWQKAFMLEPDWTKTHSLTNSSQRPDGTVPVDGQPTLWKHIPSYIPPSSTMQMQQSQQQQQNVSKGYPDLQKRLDDITQQIEALTIPTHLQSTAELFLFVAIGLVLLLAIDILLKYATVMAIRSTKKPLVGGFRNMSKWRRV